MDIQKRSIEQLQEQIEKISKYIQEGLIYIRKEQEIVIIASFEHVVEKFHNLCKSYKQDDLNNLQFKELKNKIKDQIQRIQKEILKKHSQHYLQFLAQDLEIIIQNPLIDEYNYYYKKKDDYKKRKIPISQIAYQQLFSFLDREKLQDVYDYLKKRIISNDKVLSLQDEYSYLDPQLIKELEGKDVIKKVKLQSCVRPGYELSIWRKLDQTLKNVKSANDQIYQRAWDTLPTNSQTQPRHPNSEYLLPDMKPIDKANLIKNFATRKILDQNNRPNIIQVKLTDPGNVVTCIEMTSRGNIMLAGTQAGIIYLYTLNQNMGQKNKSEKQNDENNLLNNNNNRIEMNNNNNQIMNQNQENEDIYQEENVENQIEPVDVQNIQHMFYGHSGAVTKMSLLYDEYYFLSVAMDLTIRLWCIRTKQCLAVYKQHQKVIWDVRFAENGYLFLTASADRTAMLWTTDKFSPAYIFSGHKSDVVMANFSPDLRKVYTAGLDFTIRIFEYEQEQEQSVRCLAVIIVDFQISSFDLSFDGTYMALGGREGEVQIYDILEGKLGQKIYFEQENKRSQIVDVKFNMDQSELVAISQKSFVSYRLKQLTENPQNNIYDEFYTGKQQFEEIKQKNVFINGIPLDIMQIDPLRQEQFFAISYNPKNYIVLVSK